jgi:hypothetical protein
MERALEILDLAVGERFSDFKVRTKRSLVATPQLRTIKWSFKRRLKRFEP